MRTEAQRHDSRGVRILVVEDDLITASIIVDILAEQGYQTTHATDGDQAFLVASQVRPDLIISDIDVPGLDGVSLCQKLRDTPAMQGVPVILLTSFTDVGHEALGLEAGADDYVIKPVNGERLMARVQAVLRRHLRHLEETTLARPGREDSVRVCPQCQRCYSKLATRCEADQCELSPLAGLPPCIDRRYRLVERLAAGGMGTVFKAFDERLSREVAVKLLSSQHFRDKEARWRFENEARALASIRHPHVIAVYDSGCLADDSQFIVMELLTGFTLGHILETFGRGSPGQVAALMRQGGAALEAAHSAGVLHRDIKPDNIFLAVHGAAYTVKLLDFGIPRLANIDTHITETGTLVGTPMYLAPERLNGHLASVRSDLYSFASVCYEALLGRRVTLETEIGPLIVDIVDGVPPPPSSVRAGLSATIDECFAGALDKAAGNRPESVPAWVASCAAELERNTTGRDGQEWPLMLAEP